MAFEYFLYTTDFNNTLEDRGNTSFAPLPPNTGEIFIEYFIPTNQPLYLYKESSANIILNDQQTIDEYLAATVIPSPDDSVLLSEYTGYTGQTKINIDYISGETDNKINKVLSAPENNVPTFTNDGQIKDSGFDMAILSGTTEQPTLQLRLNIDYLITTTFTNIPFTIVDVDNSININNTNEIININEDGLYFIYFDGQTTNTTTTTQVDLQILKNNTAPINGGVSLTNTYQNEAHKLTDASVVYLLSGDTISAQIKRNQTSATLIAPATLLIFSLKSIRGQKGDIGTSTGTTINLQNNDVNVLNTPHGTINFDDSFTVVDNGNGKATVSLSGTTINPLAGICELIDSAGGQNLNVLTPHPIAWGLNEFIDNDIYIHNVTTSTITVKKTGYYEVSYLINCDNQTNNRVTTGVQVRWHGATLYEKTLTASYTRNVSNDDNTNSLPPTTIHLNANEYIEIVGFRIGDDNDALTKANSSFVRIKFLG